VIPDNDTAGRAHAATVAAAGREAGIAVKVLALPGLPEHGDVSDYLNAHTKDELTVLIDAPEVGPSATQPEERSHHADADARRDPQKTEARRRSRPRSPTLCARSSRAVNGADPLTRASMFETCVEMAPRAMVVAAFKMAPEQKPQKTKSGAGQALELVRPEPWPEPVEGGALLDEIVAAHGDTLTCRRNAAETVALYVLFAHTIDAFDIAPMLGPGPHLRNDAARRPRWRSSAIWCRPPMMASAVTPSAIYRVIEMTGRRCCWTRWTP